MAEAATSLWWTQTPHAPLLPTNLDLFHFGQVITHGLRTAAYFRVMASKRLGDFVIIQRQCFHWHTARAAQRVVADGNVFQLHGQERVHLSVGGRSELELHLVIQRADRCEEELWARNVI